MSEDLKKYAVILSKEPLRPLTEALYHTVECQDTDDSPTPSSISGNNSGLALDKKNWIVAHTVSSIFSLLQKADFSIFCGSADNQIICKINFSARKLSAKKSGNVTITGINNGKNILPNNGLSSLITYTSLLNPVTQGRVGSQNSSNTCFKQ